MSSGVRSQTSYSPSSLLICSTTLLRYGRAHPYVFRQLRQVHLPDGILTPTDEADDEPMPSSSSSTDPTSSLPSRKGIIPSVLYIALRVGFAIDRFAISYRPGQQREVAPSPSLADLQAEAARILDTL